MGFTIEKIVIFINFLSWATTIFFSLRAALALRGGSLFWVAALFCATGAMYLCHSAVEVFELSDDYKAVAALIATITVAFSLVIIDITNKMLGAGK